MSFRNRCGEERRGEGEEREERKREERRREEEERQGEEGEEREGEERRLQIFTPSRSQHSPCNRWRSSQAGWLTTAPG